MMEREIPVTNVTGTGYSAGMPKASGAGRWYLILIGMFLAMAGLLFTGLMWRSYGRAREMEHWPQVDCVIFRSEAEERVVDTGSPPEYRFNVLYGYRWQGKDIQSGRWGWRGSPWLSDRDAVEQLVKQYPQGSLSSCRVDPKSPDMAVLKLDSKAAGYSIWFPALFVLGGAGIVVGAFRKRGKSAACPMP